ncbi:MAG: MFS transporter [Alphaproteobacteria bacterium]|jgi:MFS transporter, DHA1 family, inner membrane transport protein|nr:MFS transporter [Alphaproteobacteria bacterium]MBT4083785.1 MFS transporter [Alphaproteobacteria bacterium]MBT4542263.1 MFS transporter [Alphaproteobacteria bacterium]MBT7744386.1 MFS transporter [Alphaproteobacteria bacterium]
MSGFLGSAVGWRTVMALIALLALVSLMTILLFVRDRSVGSATSPAHLLSALTGKRSGLVIFTTFLQMASLFCTYALFAPFVIHKFGIAADQVFLLLLVFGTCGVFGNILAGRLSDRFGVDRIILISLIGSIIAFLLVLVAGASLVTGFFILCFWAIMSMIFHTPQQQRIANISVEQRSLLLALNAAAVYLGMSVGSWVSRTASVYWGYESLPALSAAVMALCTVVFLTSVRVLKTEPPIETDT